MSKEKSFISVLKLNKLGFNKDLNTKVSEHIKKKLSVQSVILFYQLAVMFNLGAICKITKSYIESFFATIIESKNFLELEFVFLAKLLSSSCLNIESEIEIFMVSDKWLSYKTEGRCKFAEELLSKIRFPLLFDSELKYINSYPSSFSKNKDCIAILNNVLNKKEYFLKKKSSLLFKQRSSSQNNYNILVCGGLKYFRDTKSFEALKNVTKVDSNNFEIVENLTSMTSARLYVKAVCLKGNLYILDSKDSNETRVKYIEKYSILDNCWSILTNMYDDRICYSICSFLNKIYLVGGLVDHSDHSFVDSYLQLDPNCADKNKIWKKIAKASQKIKHGSCAVFQGKIVVSGGRIGGGRYLNTVESYDVIDNKWSRMANTIRRRSPHKLVVVQNKLFVIGIDTVQCELYDSSCKRFAALKFNSFIKFHDVLKVLSVGSKILVFTYRKISTIYCYDVKTNEWSEKILPVSDYLSYFSLVKIPSY